MWPFWLSFFVCFTTFDSTDMGKEKTFSSTMGNQQSDYENKWQMTLVLVSGRKKE